MKAIVPLLTLVTALALESVTSAQIVHGVPGGYFGGGGLYSGGGSALGIPNTSPAYHLTPSGDTSRGMFRGFSYSPYSYSSPSYGLLSPSYGGTSPHFGFGTSSPLGFTVPAYDAGYRSTPYGGPSSVRFSRSYADTFRSDRFLNPTPGENFYATGIGCTPTWRVHGRVRPW